jgi:DNA-3-methyladenine glycosylase I
MNGVRIQDSGTLDPSYRQDDGNQFPIIHRGSKLSDFPTEDDISRAISKDLKKRGMSFVGSTIIYAFMQAVGMVDDHLDSCFRKTK